MGKLIILFNRNVPWIFDEYFNRAIHRVNFECIGEWICVCLYYIIVKVFVFETVPVVRDKRGLCRDSVTFPMFEGDIVVVCRSHRSGWASGYKWGPVGGAQTGPSLVKSLDFWTTGPCLDSLGRSLEVESIGRVTKVELSLLRENWYFVS